MTIPILEYLIWWTSNVCLSALQVWNLQS